jgi:hypothetical protein
VGWAVAVAVGRAGAGAGFARPREGRVGRRVDDRRDVAIGWNAFLGQGQGANSNTDADADAGAGGRARAEAVHWDVGVWGLVRVRSLSVTRGKVRRLADKDGCGGFETRFGGHRAGKEDLRGQRQSSGTAWPR